MSKLIIFTGPSGVGKATIEENLFKIKELKLKFSVSATTRKPRDYEKNGEHYHFISSEEFNEKINNNDFLEWNEHFSNRYGTLKEEVDRIVKEGDNPFLEVDIEGAKSVVNNYDGDFFSIFILPPSIQELEKRIRIRNTETEDQIQKRLERYKIELAMKDNFTYVVVNDNIDKTVKKIKEIIQKEVN